MAQILSNIQAAAVVSPMQLAGNTNANGTVVDLQGYKGAVTFLLGVAQITSGLGAAHLNSALIQDSADNTTFANVAGLSFNPVVNAANASNCGTQVLTVDIRQLRRYVQAPIQVSGTNANIPLVLAAIGQKERI